MFSKYFYKNNYIYTILTSQTKKNRIIVVYRFISDNKNKLGFRWLCKKLWNSYYNYLKFRKNNYYIKQEKFFEKLNIYIQYKMVIKHRFRLYPRKYTNRVCAKCKTKRKRIIRINYYESFRMINFRKRFTEEKIRIWVICYNKNEQ